MITRLLRRLSSPLLISLLLFSQQAAHADVWGYIDERGVAHFANEKLDDRYEIFFRGGESFDTSKTPSYKVVKHHLREASNTHKVDYELLQALIATESGFDSTAVSPKGALGLMQIMPDTARRFGVDGDKKVSIEKKLFDPKINVKTGTRYLRLLIDMFPGQLELAIASYNAGEGAVQKAGNKIPNYKETQNYVKTVMQLYTGLKPPAAVTEQRYPTRIRMEMLGGAARRGNMLAPLQTSSATLPGLLPNPVPDPTHSAIVSD